MEEISNMQQKRSLGKCRKRGHQGESTHETVPGVIAGLRKEGPYPGTGVSSLRVKVAPWLTARQKMRISVLHLPRPEFCQKPESSQEHFCSQILKKRSPANSLTLVLWKPEQTNKLSLIALRLLTHVNDELINGYCFNPLSLWQLLWQQ